MYDFDVCAHVMVCVFWSLFSSFYVLSKGGGMWYIELCYV